MGRDCDRWNLKPKLEERIDHAQVRKFLAVLEIFRVENAAPSFQGRSEARCGAEGVPSL